MKVTNHKNAGRKQFDGKNPEIILQKLEEAFSIGCTNEEAYVYAGISKSAFYAYQQNNPEFQDRKLALQTKPILLARMTLARTLKSDVEVAKWYLSKKLPDEFGTKPLFNPQIHNTINLSEEAKKRLKKYE